MHSLSSALILIYSSETPFFNQQYMLNLLKICIVVNSRLVVVIFLVPTSGDTVDNYKTFRFPELLVFTTYKRRFDKLLFFSQ